MKFWRSLIPNIFTASSLGVGITSIIFSIEKDPTMASWMILWCVLLDKADGTAARLLKVTSQFGVEFDSMADLVAFGLAPTFLIYQTARITWGVNPLDPAGLLVLSASGIYAICAAVRLARFNSIPHPPSERFFVGVPSTLCGAIVSASLLVSSRVEISIEWMKIFPIVVLLLGLGMVSKIKIPKVVRRRNTVLNIFQLINVVAVYLAGFAMLFPEYLLGVALMYLLGGAIFGLFSQKEKDAQAG